MTSMFEYLMADFDKHEAAANNSNTPLYMRYLYEPNYYAYFIDKKLLLAIT